MYLEHLKDITLDDFTVFASLPDMGKVGGIVSTFLIENLDCIPIAEIKSNIKPWVSHYNGVINLLYDIYRIYYNKKNNLIIFNGNSQPQQPEELLSLSTSFINYITTLGTPRRLYSAGGYFRNQLTGSPRVYGVVNRPNMTPLLKENKVDFVENEINSITWFNGVILGIAAEKGIEGIGLFGEISDTSIPQPLAAKSILRSFGRIEKITLNLRKLDEMYEFIINQEKEKKSKPNDESK